MINLNSLKRIVWDKKSFQNDKNTPLKEITFVRPPKFIKVTVLTPEAVVGLLRTKHTISKKTV